MKKIQSPSLFKRLEHWHTIASYEASDMRNLVLLGIICGFNSFLWAGPQPDSAHILIRAAQLYDQGDIQGSRKLLPNVQHLFSTGHVQSPSKKIENQIVSILANSKDSILWKSASNFLSELGRLDILQQIQLIDALGEVQDLPSKSDSTDKFLEITQILSYSSGGRSENRNEFADSPRTQQALLRLLTNSDASQMALNWSLDVLGTHARLGYLYPSTQLALANLANCWNSRNLSLAHLAKKAIYILVMGKDNGLSILIRGPLIAAINKTAPDGPRSSEMRYELSRAAAATYRHPFPPLRHIRDFACAFLFL